jgi:hypothetical protein
MVDIPATILRKIEESAVFVADLTPLTRGPSPDGEPGKALPNPNVCVELGWALKAPGYERVIAVMNTHGGYVVEDLPFDLRQRRVMTYELAEADTPDVKAKVKKELIKSLADALQTNLRAHVESKDAERDIQGVPANATDRSIWASARPTTVFHEGGARRSFSIRLRSPRGYIRVIPASWKSKPPSGLQIMNFPDQRSVWPPMGGGGSGWYGTTEDGFVRFLFSGDLSGENKVQNLAYYFESTGEFWLLHGSVFFEQDLAYETLMYGWWKAMRQALPLLDELGASPLRKVEVGAIGLQDVRWPGSAPWTSTQGRRSLVTHARQGRDWTEETQASFLLGAYNEMRDCFSLEPVGMDALTTMRKQWS